MRQNKPESINFLLSVNPELTNLTKFQFCHPPQPPVYSEKLHELGRLEGEKQEFRSSRKINKRSKSVRNSKSSYLTYLKSMKSLFSKDLKQVGCSLFILPILPILPNNSSYLKTLSSYPDIILIMSILTCFR
jgi:hypothetical protein